jgi:hypothetical protein
VKAADNSRSVRTGPAAQQGFELAAHFLDWIGIGTVGGRELRGGASRFDHGDGHTHYNAAIPNQAPELNPKCLIEE